MSRPFKVCQVIKRNRWLISITDSVNQWSVCVSFSCRFSRLTVSAWWTSSPILSNFDSVNAIHSNRYDTGYSLCYTIDDNQYRRLPFTTCIITVISAPNIDSIFDSILLNRVDYRLCIELRIWMVIQEISRRLAEGITLVVKLVYRLWFSQTMALVGLGILKRERTSLEIILFGD